MRFRSLPVVWTKRLLPLSAAVVLLAVLIGPGIALAADTSSTEPPTATTSAPAGTATAAGQVAIIPPTDTSVQLNPGLKTDQMRIRVLPEYDEHAVLVIVNLSLPADVPLPTTFEFPVPKGAQIVGIGEIRPDGNFEYNNPTPVMAPGAEWDTATIQVKSYPDIQIDYYYDPGLPQGAGQRSFPLLVQIPMDAGTVVLHVQQPARSTDFQVQPAPDAAGQVGDGFTYAVATFTDVKAGSALGHLISYNKSDGGLSIDAAESTSSSGVSTNTVLLTAILIVVVIVGALVVYRLFFGSSGGRPQGGSRGARRRKERATQASANKQQRKSGKAQATATQGKGPTKKNGKGRKTDVAATGGAAMTGEAPESTGTAPEVVTAEEAEAPEVGAPADEADTAAERTPEPAEYCVACGEELVKGSPFCPNCGEARS